MIIGTAISKPVQNPNAGILIQNNKEPLLTVVRGGDTDINREGSRKKYSGDK